MFGGGDNASSASYRYTTAADRDLEGILRYTERRFGRAQRQRYAELIDTSAALLAEEP